MYKRNTGISIQKKLQMDISMMAKCWENENEHLLWTINLLPDLLQKRCLKNFSWKLLKGSPGTLVITHWQIKHATIYAYPGSYPQPSQDSCAAKYIILKEGSHNQFLSTWSTVENVLGGFYGDLLKALAIYHTLSTSWCYIAHQSKLTITYSKTFKIKVPSGTVVVTHLFVKKY